MYCHDDSDLHSRRAGRGAHPCRGLPVPRPWRWAHGSPAACPWARPGRGGDLAHWRSHGMRRACGRSAAAAAGAPRGKSARDAPACIQIVPGTVERAQAGQRSARDAPPSPASKRVARHARRGGGSRAQRRACTASAVAGRRADMGREGRRDRLRRPLLAACATARGALPEAVLRRRSWPARISPTSLPLRRSSTRPGSAAAGRPGLGRRPGKRPADLGAPMSSSRAAACRP